MMIICEQYLYLIKKRYTIKILPVLTTLTILRTKLQQITLTIYLIKIYIDLIIYFKVLLVVSM